MLKKHMVFSTKWLGARGEPHYIDVAVPYKEKGTGEEYIPQVLEESRKVMEMRSLKSQDIRFHTIMPLYAQPIYVLSEEELA